MERLETANDRFLKSNLKEAVIKTGKNQTIIRIWSVLEIKALGVLKDLADEKVVDVTAKEETENVRACLEWLEQDDEIFQKAGKS